MREKPLNGWKEIAGYLGVSVKTAQRWEKEKRLPVHRPGDHERGPKSAVFVYPSELSDWVRGRKQGLVREGATGWGLTTFKNIICSLETKLFPHSLYVLLWSLFYSSFFATAVVLEVAYELPRFEYLAFVGAPLSALGVFAVTVATFWWLDWLIRQETQYIQLAGSLALVGTAAVNVLIFSWLLPGRPVTLASFQTLAASTAYFKTTSYALFVGVTFMLPPYVLVRALENQIQRGKITEVSRLLSGDRSVPAPPGVIYFRPWMLGVTFILSGWTALAMMTHLLDNLILNQFTWLFQRILWFRMILFVLLSLATLWWFWTNLDNLKRQCDDAEETSRDKPTDWGESRALL